LFAFLFCVALICFAIAYFLCHSLLSVTGVYLSLLIGFVCHSCPRFVTRFGMVRSQCYHRTHTTP
jgi:hypothetical protein